ncbi:ABC transporter substrate-binding protein [Natrinema versiforme]|uniref:ABC transporter substrate-binding protein n=1 Tax=Natrinema versiforme TaxID=88724 RepID=A0A4V1FYT4_9EURY|nr:ABC transporter substrate-binding protein [Natrinema versiforme]QCS41435.1 ABC transporter substrate-binding protein [Natrinema versiforme]
MDDDDHGRGNVGSPTDDGQQRGLDRRQMLKTTAGSAAGLSIAGCLETAGSIVGDDEVEPVTIGVLAPDPGSDSTGRSIVQGAQIAVNELNDDGGILGRDVEMVVGDTNSSPLEARRQYQRLVLEEGADVTVGISTTEALVPLMEDIAEQETIHLTAGSATTTASQNVADDYEKYKYHFRVGPVNGTNLAQAQIDFLTDKSDDLGWDSVAVLAEDYAWTDGLWAFYQSQFPETDIDVEMWERYPPATDDFSDIYTEIEESGADAAFISTAHTGTAALQDWRPEEREFEFGGIHVPMQDPAYYDATEGACEYATGYASATATAQITSKTQGFAKKYQNENGGTSPVYTGYIAFDAIKVFADAAERGETLESEQLVTPLEETSFEGTTGNIEFHGQNDEHPHDVIYGEDKVHPVYFQWQENDAGEGEQTVIWPEQHAAEGDEYETPDWL